MATKLMDSIGLNKPPTSLLTAPTVMRLSNSKRNNTFDGSLSPNANNSGSSNSSSISINTLPSRYLSSSVTSDKEFDVTFDDVSAVSTYPTFLLYIILSMAAITVIVSLLLLSLS